MTDHIRSFGSLNQILLAQRYEITAHITVLFTVQSIQRHSAQAFVYLRPLAFQAGSILAQDEELCAEGVAAAGIHISRIEVARMPEAHDDVGRPDARTAHTAHHTRHSELHALAAHAVGKALAHWVLIAKQVTCKLLAHHCGIPVLQHLAGSALQEREVEDAEEGGVGHKRCPLKVSLVGQHVVDLIADDCTERLNLRDASAQHILCTMVTAIVAVDTVIILQLEGKGIDAAGLCVHAVSGVFSIDIQPYQHREHQTDRKAKHIDGCIHPVARQEGEV